jgi:hypothetical protein
MSETVDFGTDKDQRVVRQIEQSEANESRKHVTTDVTQSIAPQIEPSQTVGDRNVYKHKKRKDV